MDFLFLGQAILAIIISLFIVTLIQDVYCYYWLQVPPGPWSLPIIGCLHLIDSKLPHYSFKRLSHKYGGILSLKLGPNERIVFVNDLQLLNKICYSKTTSDRPQMNVFNYLTKGIDGIGSATYGDSFQKQKRQITRAINTVSMTSAQYKIEKVTKLFLKKLSALDGKPYNPKESVLLLTITIFSSIIYGLDYSNLNDPELQLILSDHKTVLNCLRPLHPINLFSFLWWFPNKWTNDLFHAIKRRDTIIKRKCHENQQIQEHEKPQKENLIHILMIEKQQLEESVIKNLIMSSWTVFLAGSETINSLYQWVIFYLGLYPEIQDNLYYHINKNIKSDTFPKIQQKTELPYVCAFILEMLRTCQPNIIGIPHCTSADTKIGGHNIPKGTTIMLGLWDVLNSTKFWNDPSNFNPDRFLDDDKNLVNCFRLPEFVTYGKGNRMCPGSKITLDIMFILVTALVKSYHVNIHIEEGESLDIKGYFGFGLEPSPYKVKLEKRVNVDFDKFLNAI